MRALVVYESMYGNTHAVADAIARGLQSVPGVTAEVVSVRDVDPARAATADLLVVGGPTHVHGLSSATSRKAAVEATEKPGSDLHLEPGAAETGVRDWLESVGPATGQQAAAFDTRVDVAVVISGRASKLIGRRLRKHGYDLIADPESFLVDKQTHLLYGELDRAEEWGRTLGTRLPASV
jgi:hypothetical protein